MHKGKIGVQRTYRISAVRMAFRGEGKSHREEGVVSTEATLRAPPARGPTAAGGGRVPGVCDGGAWTGASDQRPTKV